jgi:hypothetical protein
MEIETYVFAELQRDRLKKVREAGGDEPTHRCLSNSLLGQFVPKAWSSGFP